MQGAGMASERLKPACGLLKAAVDELGELLSSLRLMKKEDGLVMESQLTALDAKVNSTDTASDHPADERLCHDLLREAQQRVSIAPTLCAAAVTSSKAADDLKLLNPFLTDRDGGSWMTTSPPSVLPTFPV